MITRDPIYLDEESSIKESKIKVVNGTNLFKLGFSTNQSKVYFFLSKRGFKTAPQLSKSLDIPRTETYHLLKKLEEKECIFKINEKPLKFGAIPIENFLEKWINLERNKIKNLEEKLAEIKKSKLNKSFGTAK